MAISPCADVVAAAAENGGCGAAVSVKPPPAAAAADAGGGGGGELRRLLTPILFLAAVALPCAVLYRAAAPVGLPRRAAHWRFGLPATPPAGDGIEFDVSSEDARLDQVLREAAMANDTVILTTLNSAWSEPGSVFDLFLESFRIGEDTRGLLNHLVIVSLDLAAHRRCRLIHPHCFALITKGIDFSGEKSFMSDGYLKMMWRRIDFLRVVLEKGYSFIFSDTDIMWFRNPLPHFYPDGDFQIACDHFTGEPGDLENRPNGGFNYVRSNSETVEFYKFWYASRERHPGYHDQDVLNFIKRDPFVAELGIRIRFLSTELFGGICEPSRNLTRVCTMHANCCIGLHRKIHDLRVMLQDWRMFMSLPPKIRASGAYSWSVPQNCSLKALQQ